jgi:predicted MFS family arabinose efflux permease|tara:strand:- start:41033 stop:42241 length:1209 start_codon:yes stop_codon:yes gene_type:complete
MFKKIISSYTSSFKGLSKEVWWLAFITLINRAGTMVIPFLSLYLTKSKGFSLGEVAWIMAAFGIGSVSGSWLGGYLTDKIGGYKTIVFSLFSSGLAYIVLQYMGSFYSIMLAVFVVLLLADIYRPAMFVVLKANSKPENQTRSLTLIRLAINLGFSLGPVLGGFLIFNLGYGSLFWVDGVSCLIAVILIFIILKPKPGVQQKEEVPSSAESPYKDRVYLFFCLGLVLFGLVFLQYFSTVPLYYRDVFNLNEQSIGLLLGFNGLLVFLIEMPLIHALDKPGKSKTTYLIWGMILLLISYLVMILFPSILILWAAILLMSFAEMFFFPFSNAIAMERSKKGKTGQYMALYSISFSVSHIFGHSAGMQMISYFNFNFTWWILVGVTTLGILIFGIIGKRFQQKRA